MENSSICCTLTVEEVSTAGNVATKGTFKNITLTIGRDQFKEMQLRISYPKKESKYAVKELVIHKKFVKEGKATVKLPDHRVHLMMSNCPPDKLVMFLRTLQTKLAIIKDKGFLSQRQRLMSGKNHEFDEISPLTVKDLQVAHKNKSGKTSSLAAPPSAVMAKLASRKRLNESPLSSQAQPDGKRSKLNPTGVPKILTLGAKINGISPSKVLARAVVLTPEQNRVLEAVKRGKNIFFTGSAGTGKSFLLKKILGALPPHHTFATASTGVAACHIGGTTLHAFAGIGSGKNPLQQCIDLASRPRVAQQWRACRHLIIDEISMVEGDLFDKLEAVARVVRKSDDPFGGIQLILCGDFLQLPPVTRPGETRKFCFQAGSWSKCVSSTMQLTDVKRQSDQAFISILQKIRKGLCPDYVTKALLDTRHNKIEKDGVIATRLCTHKVDVEDLNVSSLKQLEGDSKIFQSTDSEEGYSSMLDTQCPVPAKLELKLGAQVILCKNLDVQRGLVNGARGVVTGYDGKNHGNPIVKFVCGVTDTMKTSRFIIRVGPGSTVVRRQIPLKLAWAISIHKSQGMTLDCVEISLAKVFETGQAYVALSRAKSLEGLRVLDFTKACVRVDPRVLNFYGRLDLSHRMMHNGVEDDNEIFRPNHSKLARPSAR